MVKVRILLSIFLLIFLIGLASAKECSMSGYKFCRENEDTQNSLRVYAKVYYTTVSQSNQIKDNYIINKAIVNVGYEGDKLYLIPDGSNLIYNCNENGCSGNIKQVSSGQITVANKGEEVSSCLSFFSWDRTDGGSASCTYYSDDCSKCGGETVDGTKICYSCDICTGGGWIWLISGGAYVYPCTTFKVVECYDNSDCSLGYSCDKSGDWKSWKCFPPECQLGQDKCIGSDYYSCENYIWTNKGKTQNKCGIECNEGSSKCEGKILYECLNGKWLLRGERADVCKIPLECSIPSDCEGKAHTEVAGGWKCIENKCIWEEIKEDYSKIILYSFLILAGIIILSIIYLKLKK